MTSHKSLAVDDRQTFESRKAAIAQTAAPQSGIRSYQDLDGGVGKEVNFRPPRYPSAELGPIGAVVSVEIAREVHACQLHDVSQNGVAFVWNGGPLEGGETLPLLTVSFDRHEAY